MALQDGVSMLSVGMHVTGKQGGLVMPDRFDFDWRTPRDAM